MGSRMHADGLLLLLLFHRSLPTGSDLTFPGAAGRRSPRRRSLQAAGSSPRPFCSDPREGGEGRHDHRVEVRSHRGRRGRRRAPHPHHGLHAAHHPRRAAQRHRRHRRRSRQGAAARAGVARVRGVGHADPAAVQAGQPRGQATGHAGHGGRRRGGRPGHRGHGRAVLGGVTLPGHGRRGAGEGGRRARAARRRLQAAHLALRVPGARDRGAEAAGRGPAGDGTAGDHRGDGARQGRAGGRALRHSSDRRAQRAELLAAAARGRDPQAGAAQARHVHQRSRSGCCPPSTCWPAATRT